MSKIEFYNLLSNIWYRVRSPHFFDVFRRSKDKTWNCLQHTTIAKGVDKRRTSMFCTLKMLFLRRVIAKSIKQTKLDGKSSFVEALWQLPDTPHVSWIAIPWCCVLANLLSVFRHSMLSLFSDKLTVEFWKLNFESNLIWFWTRKESWRRQKSWSPI